MDIHISCDTLPYVVSAVKARLVWAHAFPDQTSLPIKRALAHLPNIQQRLERLAPTGGALVLMGDPELQALYRAVQHHTNGREGRILKHAARHHPSTVRQARRELELLKPLLKTLTRRSPAAVRAVKQPNEPPAVYRVCWDVTSPTGSVNQASGLHMEPEPKSMDRLTDRIVLVAHRYASPGDTITVKVFSVSTDAFLTQRTVQVQAPETDTSE